jgi:hypothetical protein
MGHRKSVDDMVATMSDPASSNDMAIADVATKP